MISNLGIMISFHFIFIQPEDIQEGVYDNEVFFIWEVACLLKAFRINKIFMKMINYKIIIRTITDVYPLIKDLLTLLLVVILLGSSVFMSLFGGKINDNY